MKEKIKKFYEEHKEEIEATAKKVGKIGGMSLMAFAIFTFGRKCEAVTWALYLEKIKDVDPNFKVADIFDKDKLNQIFDVIE